MLNESEMELPYLVVQMLLEKSETSSLSSRKDALAMAATLNNDEYNTLTLTPTERLYCNLLRIKEQKSRFMLSAVENTTIETQYSKTFYLLWKEWEKNEASEDCYNSINLLSEALYEANRALPDEEKIKPTFSEVTFTAKRSIVPPGNFAYCYLNNVTFINVEFSEWGNTELEGVVFQNCVFDEGTYCQAYNFEKVKSIKDCKFIKICSELGELGDSLGKNKITLTNSYLIELMMDHKQEIRKLKAKLAKIKQQNQVLENKLLLTSPETSISCFFQSVKRKLSSESGDYPAQDNKKFQME